MSGSQHYNDATNAEARGRDRRRWRLNFVLHERRTGFDRRRPGTRSARFQERVLVRLRDRDRNVLALLVTANILNVLDFLFTLRALDHGAVEANPFMRMLLSLDPATAGAVKVAIMLGTSLLVWRFRRYRLPLLAGVALPVVFGLVFLYHLYGVTVTGI
ncbi:MAG: DUF5658 family protein [Thermoleophilia bacterium]|nr:DUF5658 family protein [Thermoleophilia bacterium]